MKVWFKRGLFSLVVLAIVTVVGGAIFLLTFNPNSYKQKLADVVQQKYQRTLKIDGDIELSLFPRIGLSVQGLSLSDRNSDDPFASLESARFAVALWPLINNRLVVDHVAVTGFKAWIVRDEEGHFNFDDLLQAAPAAAAAPQAAPAALALLPAAQAAEPAAAGQDASSPVPELIAKRSGSDTDFQIDIAGLSLKGGEIHYYSKRSNVIGRLVQLEVNTGRMTFGQPFDVALKGRVSGDYPSADGMLEGQGQFRMDPAAKSYSAQKLNLLFNGELDQIKAQSLALKGNVAYNASQRQFNATSLDVQLQGQWLGQYPLNDLSATLATPKMQIDSAGDLVSFEKLGLRVNGKNEQQALELALDAPRIQVSPTQAEGDPIVATMKVSGPRVLGLGLTLKGIAGNSEKLLFQEARLEGAVKQGNRVAQIKAVSPAQWQPAGQWLRFPAIAANLRVEDEAAAGSRFEIPLSGDADLNMGQRSYQAQLSSQTDQAQGTLDLSLQGQDEGRLLKAALKADKLDLDELRSIFWLAAPGLTQGVEAQPEPAAKAPAAEQEESPEPKPAPAPAVEEALVANADPLAWLKTTRLDVSMEAAQLKSLGLKLEQVKGRLQNQGENLQLKQLTGKGYEGQFQFQGSLEPGKQFDLSLKLQKMQVGSLLLDAFGDDQLSGQGDVQLNLKGQGATVAARLASLEGGLQFDLQDGGWRGVDLDQSVRDINEAVRNAFSGQIPLLRPESDPQRRTVFSRLQSSLDIKQGQGVFRSLKASTPLLTLSMGKPAGLDMVNQQADVLLQARLNARLDPQERKSLQDLRNVAIPLRVSGPWQALSYQVQWKEIASPSIKKALQDGLLDLLSQQEAPAEESAQDAPEPQAVQTLGDALKGLMRP
ncbi:AsmA family protein [Alcaligenes sp. WGS1538]|uniref:AsmA family protein n=1 Tax=Alcaligenes sp. WGS1538 TaxID=3366811 RepID=UPI00372D6478